jgi:isopentenyl diphosphate isomerase/L-lactate dehydrogenase-like FMN-dependent dehydrogenase
MSTTVLGEPVSMPILIAPTALQGPCTPRRRNRHDQGGGRRQDPRNPGDSFDHVDRGSHRGGHRARLFQLYVFRDRAITASLVQRAEAAGCKAVVLTVDAPMLGRRERDVRNRLLRLRR